MREHKNPQVLVDKFRRRLYTTEHKVGENNVNILGLELHNPVFLSPRLRSLLLHYSPYCSPILLTYGSMAPKLDSQ